VGALRTLLIALKPDYPNRVVKPAWLRHQHVQELVELGLSVNDKLIALSSWLHADKFHQYFNLGSSPATLKNQKDEEELNSLAFIKVCWLLPPPLVYVVYNVHHLCGMGV